MKIVQTYSHLNGLEHLLVHKRKLWAEIQSAIKSVDSDAGSAAGSAALLAAGQVKFSPMRINRRLKEVLKTRDWHASRVTHWITAGENLALPLRALGTNAQKCEIEKAGLTPVRRQIKFDLVKDRVAINVPLGKSAMLSQDMFAKHVAFYMRDQIDVGIEILPMKSLQQHMSSGPGYYEGELYNVIRNGRGVPPVPLVVISIAP